MRPTDVCHPNELRAPAPRMFPAPHATYAAGTPHGVLGSARHDWGTGRFTTSEDRFGGSWSSACSPLRLSHDWIKERGRFLPTALMRPSLWHPCRDLLCFILTPHTLSRVLQSGRLTLLLALSNGSEDAEIAKITIRAVSWKPTPRDDPGCLLSVGTLRRIRWPLQPRSRDPHTAFGDGRTAEWHSRVILGLAPVLSRL